MSETHTFTIAFFGRYKPAHFESDKIERAAWEAIRATELCAEDFHNEVKTWARAVVRAAKAGKTFWNVETSGLSLTYQPRAHDPITDSMVADYPERPGLQYPAPEREAENRLAIYGAQA